MEEFDATDLLIKVKDPGYPQEYLLSRIRGRKVRLIQDWAPLVASREPLERLAAGHYQMISGRGCAEDIWKALLNEYRWVYGQMDRDLRTIFGPFFIYAEFRTLFICLRNLKEMQRARIRESLSASLLSQELRGILSDSADEFEAAQALEAKLSRLSGQFSGISEVLRRKGPGGFEHELTKRYLSVIGRAGLAPFLQRFFTRLIDARNILALAKLFKLDNPAEHDFITGGTVGTVRLREILGNRNLSELVRLLREITGEEISPADIIRLEASLYRGITRSLKKEGRSPLGIGLILEYLWRCSIEAINLSVLCHTRELERELVAAELLQ